MNFNVISRKEEDADTELSMQVSFDDFNTTSDVCGPSRSSNKFA